MSDVRRELAELRAKAREQEHALVDLLDQRARTARDLRARLEVEPASIEVDEREWLAQLETRSDAELAAPALRAVLREVRAAMRAIELPVRVAFLAPEGGTCHEIARRHFGQNAELIEGATPAAALDDVVRGRAAFAVLPFESSEDGLVQSTLNALAGTELVIVAERSDAVVFDLWSSTGIASDVEKIYATSGARDACERFLSREFARVPVFDVRSPALAVQLATGDHGSAALVPAAKALGDLLHPVRANVGDAAGARMRFGIIGARPAMRSGSDTTCLNFSVDDSPGALFAVLRHFAERGINLKKLQSRPVSGDYVFYAEVSGHVTDRPVVTALEAVKRATKYLRVLGSFAVAP